MREEEKEKQKEKIYAVSEDIEVKMSHQIREHWVIQMHDSSKKYKRKKDVIVKSNNKFQRSDLINTNAVFGAHNT